MKIVFSDTNTHHRGESNYRTSGVVDAMRIPKDAFFAHQVMWSGWVEPEQAKTYIIGHWNYDTSTVSHQPSAVKKPVYVVSTGDEVELLLNGRSLGKGRQSYRYLFTFCDVPFEPGTLEAVASDGSRCKLETVGEPYQLKLTAIANPEGTKADGADMVLFQVEVLDSQGRRCPLDDRMIHFQMWGEGQWIGGIGTRDNRQFQRDDLNRDKSLLDAANKKNTSDNYVGHMSLPVECGVNRVLVRSTTHAGEIGISVQAEGLKPAYLSLNTQEVDVPRHLPQLTLKPSLVRGETPLTPSYRDYAASVDIVSAQAGSNAADIQNSYDDNELSEWKSDGKKENAQVTYHLGRKAAVSELTMKLTGWRNKCYPLEVDAGKQKVWEGITDATLGYAHIRIDRPVPSDRLTIRMVGPVQDSSKFGDTKELAGGNAGEFDRIKSAEGKVELRIVELDILESLPADEDS